MDSKGYEKKSYRSRERDCKNCPWREECCGKATKFKKLEESIHKSYYDRMHEKLTSNPRYAKKISKIRSRTVELVLGTLINFLNMKKINSRGMAQANKHTIMAALSYNLKKYLNFSTKLRKIGVNMLQKAVNQLQNNQIMGVNRLIVVL